MASDKRGGRGAGQQRPVPAPPGSVNRGFASLDPERQRETVGQAGHAPAADATAAGKGRERGAPATRRRPPRGTAPPARATSEDDPG